MVDVLLTYGWVRSSYAALRNLSDHGVRVWVTDQDRVGMSQWSRFKVGFSRYPNYYANEAAFVDRIASLCAIHNVKYIFPSHNETEILAKHRRLLPVGTDRLIPHFEHCALLNNKSRATELAKSLNIPVPRKLSYRAVSEIEQNAKNLGFTRMVVRLLTGNSAKGVYFANSGAEAQQLVHSLVARYRLASDRYPMIEEWVSGSDVSCAVLYWDGEPIVDFCHKSLREKTVNGGTSTFREAFSHVGISQASRQLFTEIKWHGLAQVDFKWCEETNKFWFIEVNPRLWGSLPLAVSGGIEFPYLAWLCAERGPAYAKEYASRLPKKNPWRVQWLLGDLTVALATMIRGDLSMAKTILKDTFRADFHDDLPAGDPYVFWGELINYLLRVVKSRSLNPEQSGMVR